MSWKQLFATKSLERLLAEMEGENRLRRALGPIALTSLGVGAIIGAGIFVTTGETAALKAGPAVMFSYAVAALGCAFAALCYAEFASMAPVAGSAYTYAYATLGELFAWIIGWDLVLEYAMSCGVVAADWTKYFNEFLEVFFRWQVPLRWASDPASADGALLNLPAVVIMALVTVVLVIGIRESATTNALLVITKVGVVIFVIVVGCWFVNPANWTRVPVEYRKLTDISDLFQRRPDIARLVPEAERGQISSGEELFKRHPEIKERLSPQDYRYIKDLRSEVETWGLFGVLGGHHWLQGFDARTRTPFMPYGLSGVLAAAAAVFFAYIGFDSISTHAEEAKKPQRDVPIGILASLGVCTILYFGVSAVITGMEPYYQLDPEAAVASAFRRLSEKEHLPVLRLSAGLIATGALAGMTSVLLITLLSQARIFLAMARDGLLPPGVFGAVHHRFRTPHLSTILTGALLCVITAFTPISLLFNMVNIGTLLAFVIVCAAVLLLRITRPDAHRPFRCPAVFLIAPLGVAANLLMMLFLPLETWLRLVGWLAIGLVIYFGYGYRHTIMARVLWRQLAGQDSLPDEAYYRSEEYHRRLRFSVLFCAALAALSWVGWAVAVVLWRKGKLTFTLTFDDPATVVWLALGAAVFTTFMFVANLLEWQKVRAAKIH
jgi:APA family basic amino acid/polyamine antiporter